MQILESGTKVVLMTVKRSDRTRLLSSADVSYQSDAHQHGLQALGYLDEMCTPVSTVPYLSALRSAAHGDLFVPRTRLQLGNRAFCVAGPVAWNSLPLDIRLGTYIINVQSDAQDTSVFSILLQ